MLVYHTAGAHRNTSPAFLTGLLADLLLRWLKPSYELRKQFALIAFLLPVILYSLYYLTLQLTHGIAWTIHLWLGSIFLAGGVGLLLGYLLRSSIRPAAETVHSSR